MSEIIKLNLVYSYPVSWSTYYVLRDYVQNFYDAIGFENFAKDFNYDYIDGTPKCSYVNMLLTDFIGDCIQNGKIIKEMGKKWDA